MDLGIQFIVLEVGKIIHSLVSFSRSLHRLDLFRKIGPMKSREISESHMTLGSMLVLLLWGGNGRGG